MGDYNDLWILEMHISRFSRRETVTKPYALVVSILHLTYKYGSPHHLHLDEKNRKPFYDMIELPLISVRQNISSSIRNRPWL